ncbi:MAG: FecR family protein [Chitinophagaceae bacterium]|nr:MAG: FecR family protein [Chitinophagaceae bacterium]
MQNQDYNSLYEKFLAGACTEEEIKLLENHFPEIKLMDNTWNKELGDEQLIRQSILSRISEATGIDNLPSIQRRPRFTWIGYAASFIILLSITIFYVTSKSDNHQLPAANIMPDKNEVYILLADGKMIGIKDINNNIIDNAPGLEVRKTSDSSLVYTAANNNTPAPKKNTNKIFIPSGSNFRLALSDGTIVWLNAASSLEYPVVFTGKERKVTLSGEAYFEVAKNKEMPFSVSVNGMNVEVLGTHFNVIGYNTDEDVKTTLLEGSVKLRAEKSTALLTPGQQGIYHHNKPGFAVNAVNTSDVIAWKNGFFVFDNESLQEIMQKIARWYNVDVVFQNKSTARNFGGTISRNKSIDVVLRTLEATGSVHFKLEKGRITVTD